VGIGGGFDRRPSIGAFDAAAPGSGKQRINSCRPSARVYAASGFRRVLAISPILAAIALRISQSPMTGWNTR
jgi:hypothetical protein